MLSLQISAKLNLFLDITGIREDGYHLLSTVMQSVDIYDTLTFKESERLQVHCSHVLEEQNTAYKAAVSFFEKAKIPSSWEIFIDKQIPLGAGLGGSSADAAGVLLMLNRIYGQRFSASELRAIGAKIGADVPFLLHGGTMLCSGIGEEMQAIKNGLTGYYLILQPEAFISAKNAYMLYDKVGGDHKDAQAFLHALSESNTANLRLAGVNALEQACVQLCPESELLLHYLRSCADYAFLTGSGSACVGYFSDKNAAQAALVAAPKQAVYKNIATSTASSVIFS